MPVDEIPNQERVDFKTVVVTEETVAKRGKKSRKRRPDQLSWRTHADALRKLQGSRKSPRKRGKAPKKRRRTARPLRKRG